MSTPSDASTRGGPWSSSLSVNDYGACLAAGLQPLGFVQGCSVVSWSFLGATGGGVLAGFRPSSGYAEQFSCPHSYVSNDHRPYGLNYEQTWIRDAWMTAYSSALRRLLEEAAGLGAHGVIGVVETAEHHLESSAYEFKLSGTAVGVEGLAPPAMPFTTFLAGQKLNKVLEAGFAPVAVALSFVSIAVYASCVTEYQLRGGAWNWGSTPTGEIEQVARAHEAARSTVRV